MRSNHWIAFGMAFDYPNRKAKITIYSSLLQQEVDTGTLLAELAKGAGFSTVETTFASEPLQREGW
ncbi:MAG: hypothetical protein ACK559_36125, partial [bacterium]